VDKDKQEDSERRGTTRENKNENDGDRYVPPIPRYH
jgi:hypothetical protein